MWRWNDAWVKKLEVLGWLGGLMGGDSYGDRPHEKHYRQKSWRPRIRVILSAGVALHHSYCRILKLISIYSKRYLKQYFQETAKIV